MQNSQVRPTEEYLSDFNLIAHGKQDMPFSAYVQPLVDLLTVRCLLQQLLFFYG